MQPAPKADQAQAINSFQVIDDAPPEVVDRSTLEAWAECPFMAAAQERGLVKVWPEIAAAGTLAHEVLGEAIKVYLDMFPHCSPRKISDELDQLLLSVRPDLQPDVIRALRPAQWTWCDWLNSISPLNIIGFSGAGDGDRCAQMTMVFAGIHVTSELDLLTSTASLEEVNIDDYKTGHASWATSDVADSFQFQLHALLALDNFAGVNTVNVRIWNTRHGTRTGYVQFHRKDYARFYGRVNAALAIREQWKHAPLETIPTWPTTSKCGDCLAARLCPAADSLCGPDPIALGQRLIALEAAYDATKRAIEGYVDSRGEIVLPEGMVIGRNKPAAERKKPVAVYTLKEKVDGS